MNGKTPDLWALFGGITHLPLLLVWGEASAILLPATIERMRSVHPDMAMVSLPGIGHAPTLNEPVIVAALREFIDEVAPHSHRPGRPCAGHP
jgi:pimeloyl-ACP methyl ester carboxylesterase